MKVADKKRIESIRQLGVLRNSVVAGYTVPSQNPLMRKVVHLCDLLEAMEARGETVPYWYDQILRAASSTGANYMEGIGRGPSGTLLQFWRYARGSAYECVFWGEVSQNSHVHQACIDMATYIDSELLLYIDQALTSAVANEDALV